MFAMLPLMWHLQMQLMILVCMLRVRFDALIVGHTLGIILTMIKMAKTITASMVYA